GGRGAAAPRLPLREPAGRRRDRGRRGGVAPGRSGPCARRSPDRAGSRERPGAERGDRPAAAVHVHAERRGGAGVRGAGRAHGGPAAAAPTTRAGGPGRPADLTEKEGTMRRPLAEVEAMMAARAPGASLEEVLEVFEVFASGSLTDEVYILDD